MSGQEKDRTLQTTPVDSGENIEECTLKAEKGSVSHQLSLAKYYRKQAKTKSDSADNGKLCVRWLLKAAKQGSRDAISLLKECVKEKTWISDDNIAQVQACLEVSHVERNVEMAASKLYNIIKPDDVEDFTKEKYMERIKEGTEGKAERRLLRSAGKLLKSGEKVDREKFVEVLTCRMRGADIDITRDDVEMMAFKEADISRKISKYPGTTASMALDSAVEYLTTDGVNMLMYLIPFDQFNLLVFFFILSLLSFGFIFSVTTIFMTYLTFLVMVISTIRMFQTKRREKSVRAVADMLKQHHSDLDQEEVVNNFLVNSMKPYYTFFPSMVIFVPSFFLCNKAWIPCAEATLMSVAFSIACFVLLSHKTDPLVIFLVIVDVVSTFPVLFGDFPDIPVLSTFVKFLTGTLISIEIMPGFHLNASLPAISYLIVPVIFIRLAFKSSSVNLQTVLVPHMVNFFWWQVATICYSNSTWLGLARGSMGWLSFAILLPFITFGGFVYGVYYAFTTFNFYSILKVSVTVFLLAIPIALNLWHEMGYSLGAFSVRGKSLRIKLAVLFVPMLLGSPLLFISSDSGADANTDPAIEWEWYRDVCGGDVWKDTNMAVTQAECSHLKNAEVNWTGVVKSVNITKTENAAEDFLDILPPVFAEFLKCIYGKKYRPCDRNNMTSSKYHLCQRRQNAGRFCHVKMETSYTFNIVVFMPLDDTRTQDILIIASDSFKLIAFHLRPGDTVNFKANLVKDMGSAHPVLHLEHINCTSCTEKIGKRFKKADNIPKKIVQAVLKTVNFFTSPLLEYKN